MRLLAPIVIGLLGALVGWLVAQLVERLRGTTGSNGAAARAAVLAGTVGGFVALWLRDILNLEIGTTLSGGLLAIIVGAAVVALPVALLVRPR